MPYSTKADIQKEISDFPFPSPLAGEGEGEGEINDAI